MRKLVLLLLILALAPAATADSTPHWVQVRSPHFIVLTDSSEKQGRHIASQFERMRAVFQKLLPNSDADSSTGPIVVLALKDRKGFQAIEPSVYLGKGQIDLAGYFLTNADKNFILLRLDAQGEHPFSVIYHEYTHFLFRKVAWLPLWMNEGLAEYYQNTDINDKDVVVGQPSSDDISFLRRNTLLPLPVLLAVDQSSPYYHDERKGSIFYAESWALMHLIISSDRDRHTDRLSTYGQYLAAGQDPVTAAQKAFGDLRQLQAALQSYVQQTTYRNFSLAFAATIDESTFQSQVIPAPEADAVRASILVDNGRTQDALALLDAVLRDDPKNALAHETMGSIKFREGDRVAATKWYKEAVQLDSDSYLAHYYFAALSMQSNDDSDNDAIEASLREAIRLNPAFAPAYDALANFYGLHREKLEEAHILNTQAVQLEPENLAYRLNAAGILVQQENFTAALDVLHAAAKVVKAPAETTMLDNRIHQVEHTQASFKSAQDYQTMVSILNGVAHHGSQSDPEGPTYPDGPPTGPHHTAKGVLHDVNCFYPTILTLNLGQGRKTITLYSNNYYKVEFTVSGFTPEGTIDPCNAIEGMQAKIEYGEVSDKTVAGQIISIQLIK